MTGTTSGSYFPSNILCVSVVSPLIPQIVQRCRRYATPQTPAHDKCIGAAWLRTNRWNSRYALRFLFVLQVFILNINYCIYNSYYAVRDIRDVERPYSQRRRGKGSVRCTSPSPAASDAEPDEIHGATEPGADPQHKTAAGKIEAEVHGSGEDKDGTSVATGQRQSEEEDDEGGGWFITRRGVDHVHACATSVKSLAGFSYVGTTSMQYLLHLVMLRFPNFDFRSISIRFLAQNDDFDSIQF